jgi:hypothetical protein
MEMRVGWCFQFSHASFLGVEIMLSRKRWIGASVMVVMFISLGWGNDQSEQETKEQKLLASLYGKWKFIDTEVEDMMHDAVITIGENEQSELARPQDAGLPSKSKEMVSKFRLELKAHDIERKMVRIRVEYIWDQPSTGGAGPRKGLCRIDDKGHLEIIETTSAEDDFPTDFSDKSKASGKYRKLARVKPSA